MSVHSILKDLQQAWNNDLPQDSLRLFREISQEYIENRQYRELGELLMLANKKGYYIKRMVEPAMFEAIEAVIKQLESEHNDALVAVFTLLLYRTYEYTLPAETWQQVFNVDDAVWHTDCRKYDWAIEEDEVLKEVFHYELMAAIGFEMEQYERLYEHYKCTDNRAAQAYLLVKMQTNCYSESENTDILEQIMADYGDLQVACEAAIAYYQNNKWHEDTDEQDKLTAMNEAATAQYEFLNRALVRWGKWHRAEILKEYLKQLCSTKVTTNTDFNELWYSNEQKRVGVRYRNAKILTLTVYQTSLTGWDETDRDELKKIAKKSKQVIEIKHKPESKAEYLYDTHEFVLDELPIGVYILFLSINEKEHLYFRQQVTNLILTSNKLHGDKTRVAVLQADSGMPAENASVRWEHKYGYRKALQKGELKCDEKGEVTVLCSNPDFFAQTPTDKAAQRGSIYSWGSWRQNSDDVLTNILTDRSIYRPGQTMHIAVVCYSVAADKTMQTLRRSLHLNIVNAEWDTLLEKTLKADDYGVAHLDFTIPQDCPTGQLQIKDILGGYNHTVRVEEYKRPTFEVVFNPYSRAYKADETIEITGKAMSYAGVAIAGGKVNYRVVRRRAHWWWFYSHYWGFEGDAYERRGETISQAETQTDEDGTFTCRVPLEMPEENDEYGYYDFVLTADVVDTTGETHSAEMVLPLSKKDYFFACSVPEQNEIHEVAVCRTVLTNTLGEQIDDTALMQIDDEEPKEIRANADITLPMPTTGEHTIRLKYKEETIERTIFIVDKTATLPPIQTNDWQYCSAERFTTDEPLYIQVGASSGKTYLLYTILNDRKIIESGHVLAEYGMLNRALYYNDEYRFGIRVCFAWVRDHEFHNAEFTILPPEEKHDLQLQWETFRNRVEPGTDEIWRLRVTENGLPADANIIATMYDKSLEQLMPHSWQYLAPRISWEVPDTLWRTHDISGQNIYFDNYEKHNPRYGSLGKAMYARRIEGADYELSESACYEAAVPCGAPPAGSADLGDEEVAPMPTPRTNFAETAFFMPQLRTDAEGGTYIEFHLPDTLTTWLVKAVAHTKQMHYGFLTDEVIAQRPVMLQPNLPRFLRAGDHATLTAKISNQTDNDLQGNVRLELKDAQTDTAIHTATKAISLSANSVGSLSFELQVGEEYQELICTMAVVGKGFSDGEQHSLPILGNTEEVMTAQSFSQLKAGKHTVQVSDILPATATNKRLSIAYTANPFWLAYEALPKIVDREAENAISVVVSLYCNHLSHYIQRIVKPNIIDNDKYFLEKELIKKLSALQKQDGGFAWYKSMHSSDFLTAEVMMHLARLTKMTEPVEALQQIIDKANQYLDRMIAAEVRKQQKREKKGYKPYFPSYATLQHLYSCALLGRELRGDTKTAYQYLVGLLKNDIHSQTIREKAMTALILEYNDEHERALIYAESLRQYTTCEELRGRWFDTDRAAYSWMSYKIPTHTLAMEVLFALQPEDKQTMSEMQVWLLQEKSTQIWETPLDCVNAVHALLLCGREDMLRKHDAQALQVYADNALVELPVETNSPTLHADISTDTLTVLFDKHFDGLSWGTVSAGFRQPLSEISQHANGMTLCREIIDNTENLHVGDRLRVRLTVQCDRNYDMVEIRDVRAACMEPVNQLTRSDSFVHIAPHDTETIYSYLGLSEGTHTIETEYYLTQVGTYQLGLATVRCCYAPEFGATCPSKTLVVV